MQRRWDYRADVDRTMRGDSAMQKMFPDFTRSPCIRMSTAQCEFQHVQGNVCRTGSMRISHALFDKTANNKNSDFAGCARYGDSMIRAVSGTL
jgi:hypothetical protein